ncbi:L,D-transpeptidase [Roseisolibacter sp. H3M3-2]|uniref:L,D-transpeptidase n=1 Tax=Roseisolibacter sp. H3M3-2 TaxID=3031323 RepID=UPI0023DBCCA8|nr:L,D-transpeptidase [Roseisolibacter sp. H3M3-2]MDF1505899.1 L,D-transpeptidase [Roseisolibacter sp. H3M3-2]
MSARLAARSLVHVARLLIPTALAAWVVLSPAVAHGQGGPADTTTVALVAAGEVEAPKAVERFTGTAAYAAAVRAVPAAERAGQVLVVSLAARRVWLLEGDSVAFTAPVAVGKGTRGDADAAPGEFATPRGRFVVTRRDSLPLWVPPDWHFEEVSKKTGRPLRFLQRRDTLRTRDGSAIYVDGAEVVRRAADGTVARMGKSMDEPGARELVVDGRIVVPPVGTTQRQYPRVLGARRLNLRDGYAFHGTDKPKTVGTASSHGCLRMRDADVTALYERVAVGTPVYLQ